jgi:hypothetical protein
MRSTTEVPFAELVLAAIDRAVRQSVRLGTDVPATFIADHLALNRRSGAWRQALRLLRELGAVGEVEQGRRLSVTVWALTDAGREASGRGMGRRFPSRLSGGSGGTLVVWRRRTPIGSGPSC